jgi:hypothetical protein
LQVAKLFSRRRFRRAIQFGELAVCRTGALGFLGADGLDVLLDLLTQRKLLGRGSVSRRRLAPSRIPSIGGTGRNFAREAFVVRILLVS